MELFKLVGQFAVNGTDEAKKEIKDTSNTASSEGGKMQKTFAKIGEAVKNAFKSKEPEVFGRDLSSLTGSIDRQEEFLDSLKKKYESLYLEFGENSKEAKDCASQIEKLSTKLKKNKDALKEAENAADKFDKSLDEAGDGAEEAENGIVEAMKKIGAAVAAAFALDAIKDFGAKCVEIADSSSSAINGFAASTGTATEELQGYEDVMHRIYKNNFGESFEDVAGAMATIKQQAGDIGADELEKMTTNALILRDTFDFEVNESMRAAKMLVDQFGISSDEAYNMIAQGAQNGLDKNGDLLDSINEYSVHYEQLGFTAEDFFNSLANGTEAGTFSVDKLGDAMKEFGIRAKDGSDGSRDAFKTLGLDADDMFRKFNKGGEDAKTATQQVIEKLMEMEPGVDQTTAGVALFGTMWEDLGAEGIAALGSLNGEISTSKNSLEEINAVKYDNIGSAISGLGRAFEVNLLMPIGEKLIPVIEKAIEKVNAFGTWCSENETTLTIIGIAIGTLAAAIGAYNIALNWATITQTIATAATAAFGAAVAFATSPITLIILAIGALIAIGVLLYKNWDEVKAKCIEVWNSIKEFFSKLWKNIKTACIDAWDNIKEKISKVWNSIKTACSDVWNGIKTSLSNVWNGIKTTVSTVFDSIKQKISDIWTGIKTTISNVVNGVKSTISTVFNSIKSTATTVWNGIKTAITSPIETAKNTISDIIEKIKNIFDFDWSLPKIKLPHFKVSGGKAPWGFMGEGSLPSVSVSWYARAMDNAMLLQSPTIFGYSEASGNLLGGGEAGNEVVAGANTLMGMIQNAVARENTGLAAILTKILEAIVVMDANMGGHLREALEDVGFEINGREFARLVKAVN